MGRIQIKLPKQFAFHTDIRVRISDINYGNHLGNDAVLRLIHEARVRFLGQYGFSELDIGGFGLILTDAAIVYKSQGFYGDPLRIAVTAAEPSRYGCDFYYCITNRATGKEVARAKTGVVLFDYADDKMAPLPDEFRRIIPPENS
jgi:acyl-CoA thioesterase FadM